MGAGHPRHAEREGPDDRELSRSDDDDGVGRDWSEPKGSRNPPKALLSVPSRLERSYLPAALRGARWKALLASPRITSRAQQPGKKNAGVESTAGAFYIM